jgi:hypothetical protein
VWLGGDQIGRSFVNKMDGSNRSRRGQLVPIQLAGLPLFESFPTVL